MCVSTCDGCDACGGAGNCATTCAADEACVGDVCIPGCVDPTCTDADGFCAGSVVNELGIAPGPTAEDPGCCCNYYDKEGETEPVIDNAIGNLLATLGPMIGMSLDELNATIAEEMEKGTFTILFEWLCDLGDLSSAVGMGNFYIGATTETAGEFEVDPLSLDADGNPMISFDDVAIADGHMSAGPMQFIIPLDMDIPLDDTGDNGAAGDPAASGTMPASPPTAP